MSDKTHIQWCDATFNPWIGCTKVSPGCANCYAEGNAASRMLGVKWGKGRERYPWESSIFMPRWASRLTLEIVSVRVERVAEISMADCLAEGIQLAGKDTEQVRHAYMKLWNSLNMPRAGCAWADNPWAWVIEFKVQSSKFKVQS